MSRAEPRLVLLNGPPGIGKSTLARRYAAEQKLAFCLDIDVFRRLIGGWAEHPEQSGLSARAMSLAMARVHLADGHDVVVPQYVARPAFVQQLAGVATDTGARFCEVFLTDGRADALERFRARAVDPELAAHHAESLSQIGEGFEAMYDALADFALTRTDAVFVATRMGEVETAYAALMGALGD